ncbi:hypothetical protein KO498_06395 [Lentibacter algarum]|uniref:DUF6531 domain-containing protein n=1 Tax=Lentibacter algarum TaxID=576131 RepID=UPI001C07CA2C|nr:DUF6531 domain-containing protein [Lentibacter algarum]MBU2981441.1 hypothetical protein [Lentibacter algarum]
MILHSFGYARLRFCIKFLFPLLAVLLLSITAPESARAGINLKNGNFYITYTDMIIGHPEFSIVRTYNSKAGKTLSFGFGWGTDLDTSLTVVGDGTVILDENGSGARRVFRPSQTDIAKRDAIVEEMLGAMEAAGWITTDKQRDETRVKLREDAEERRVLHRKLVSIDMMPERDLAVGERLVSTNDLNAFIEKEPGGYYRRGSKGYERFNQQGQLVEMVTQDKVGYRLRRSEQGHLREIIASNGERIAVSTNANGQITRLEAGTINATFEYDDRNNLISATNAVGTTYLYEYDEKHNMRFIRYEDGTYLEVRYQESTLLANFHRDQDGQVTRYEYGTNPIVEPEIVEHYFTRLRKFENESDTNPFLDRTIAYRIGRDQFGNNYTVSVKDTQNGNTTNTHYHPCGNPILIERGNRRTEFDYDDKCYLTFKKTDREQTRIRYDRRHRKIEFVETIKLSDNSRMTSEFEYNLRGDLVKAWNSKDMSVDLTYNDQNQISRMRDQNGQVLAFVYGPVGKPIQISIEGVGQIDVQYDANGEIENVASAQGHEMALKVTQAFQGLLRLVKPAGVSLNL